MKISHQDSLARSATELKYAKSRQTGIRPKAPRGIGTPVAAVLEWRRSLCFTSGFQ